MTKAGNYIKNLDVLIAAVLGFVVIYLFTRYNGIGISPDAIMYTSAARSFHDHGTLHTFLNQPIVDFPIFYPVFLALVYLISGVDPIAAGTVVNGLLFAGLLFMSGWLMQKFAPGRLLYKWVVLIFILLAIPLLEIFTYLWSETLFTFLVLVFFVAFSNYINKRTITALIIAALVAALTSITRYAGVTVIGTGGLLLLIDRQTAFKKRLLPILIYSITASSFLAANLIRNRILNGNSTGPREASVTSFGQNLSYFGSVISGWFSFPVAAYSSSVWIGALIIVVLISALLYHTFRKNLNNYLVLAITFSLVYALFLTVSASFSRFEQINDRLLAPLYVPLTWALTWWVIHLPVSWPRMRKLPVYIVFALGAIWIEYRIYKIDYQRYDDQFDYGMPGYKDDSWKTSATVSYIKKHPEFFKVTAPIYSDAPEAVYLFTGQNGIKLLPHRYFPATVIKFFALNHYYIIWFNELDNPELININYIGRKKTLKKLQQFTDGALYEYNETDQKP